LYEQKGGTREGGLVHPRGENSMAFFGLVYKSPSLGPFILL